MRVCMCLGRRLNTHARRVRRRAVRDLVYVLVDTVPTSFVKPSLPRQNSTKRTSVCAGPRGHPSGGEAVDNMSVLRILRSTVTTTATRLVNARRPSRYNNNKITRSRARKGFFRPPEMYRETPCEPSLEYIINIIRCARIIICSYLYYTPIM